MFWFGRKKEKSSQIDPEDRQQQVNPSTADTFVEATGGGWGDPADVIAADGGEQSDYVGLMLVLAREQAIKNDVAVGEDFTFQLVAIPRGIVSPHEIMFGLMMRAGEQGLSCGMMHDEKVIFTRNR